MPRHPKPQDQRGLRMWNPNPKYSPSIRIEKKLEGCTPGMILDLNACNNCPKKIKHWKIEINRGGYSNGDFIEGKVFVGYPMLPDLHDDRKDVETIQDDDCFYMKYCLNIKMPYLRTYIWNRFVHFIIFLLTLPNFIKYLMFGGDPPKWSEWVLEKCIKELNTKDYYKEE